MTAALSDADWDWRSLDLVRCRQFQRYGAGMRVFVERVDPDYRFEALAVPPIERQIVVYRPFGANELSQMPIAEFFALIEVAEGVRLPRFWPTGALFTKR